jgi:hypothetical protein
MLTWKHKWKRSFGWCRRRWKNNNKIDVVRLHWEGIDVIHLIQDRDRLQVVVDRTMNFKVKKRPRISWMIERLWASQERRCTVSAVVFPLVLIGLCSYSGSRKPFILIFYILLINHLGGRGEATHRKATTPRGQQKQQECRLTFLHRVEIEHAIPVLER